MMNLAEIKANFSDLADFEFLPVTKEFVADQYGAEVDKPGVYRILLGSRGMLEEVERIGDDESALKIMTLEEVQKTMVDDNFDDEEIEESNAYVDEFYYLAEDVDQAGVLLFAFTEEDCDVFVKVA